jgi:protein-disulfide isomerase
MDAAEAAREAYAQGGNAAFWQYHDTLFANQAALTRPDLERYAEQQGLDMARFRSALDQHSHRAEIESDRNAADATGAEMGTPATFVNGHFVSGAMPYESFQHVIDAELSGRHPRPAHR